MKTVLISGYSVIVDDDIAEIISKQSWFIKKGGYGHGSYVARSVREGKKIKTIRLHRWIMNAPKGFEVHHKNGNSFDNRRENLEVLTPEEHDKREKETPAPF